MVEYVNFLLMKPELSLLGTLLTIILIDLTSWIKKEQIIYYVLQSCLFLTAILSLSLFHQPKTLLFSGHFVSDPLASLLKFAMDLTLMSVFLYSRDFLTHYAIPRSEFYILSLFALLGMHGLVSAESMVSLFLALELFSLPLYAMIALQRNNAIAAEAAMKYFIMGSVASAILLYGLSMVYGATKAFQFDILFQAISALPPEQTALLAFGLIFIIAGIVFKLGMVPFHMWVPDVYEGAPSAITLLIATAAKIAALGLAIRLLVDGLVYYHLEWHYLLMAIALLSISLGNMVAIIQVNLKRLLAYSSIAHMGYTSLGLIAGTPAGYSAALFYMLMYVLMSLGVFGMIVILSQKGIKMETLEDFKGLHHRNPWLAFLMLLMMFSMAGIPPTVGFFAKMTVLEALVRVHLAWLAVVAIVFAIVGAYYYLQIVRVMYFDTPKDKHPIELGGLSKRLTLSINGLAVLGLGLFPTGLFMVCRSVFN